MASVTIKREVAFIVKRRKIELMCGLILCSRIVFFNVDVRQTGLSTTHIDKELIVIFVSLSSLITQFYTLFSCRNLLKT